MAEEKTTEQEEFKEPQVGFAKFEKPGDEVIGTYIGKVNIPAKGIYKEQLGYQLLVDGAEVIVAFAYDPIKPENGKKYIHSCMKSAKHGQRVKFVFEDWFEQDSYKKALEKVGGDVEKCQISKAKSIKVYLGKMDELYLNGFKEVQLEGEELPEFGN